MKSFQIGWVFLLAILFSACQGGLTGDPFLDNQGRNLPLTDSIRQLAADGYIHIDSSHAGNPLIQTVMVRVSPSFSQKVAITKHTRVFGWAVALVIVAWLLIGFGIWYSSNAGKFTGAAAWIFVLAIVLHFSAFSLVDSAHTKEIAMPKMQYDFLKSQPGDQLKQYVDQILFQ
jgi:hypothetical protein